MNNNNNNNKIYTNTQKKKIEIYREKLYKHVKIDNLITHMKC